MAPHDSSENLAKLVEKMDKDCQCATNKKDKDGKSGLNITKNDNIKLQLRSTSLEEIIFEGPKNSDNIKKIQMEKNDRDVSKSPFFQKPTISSECKKEGIEDYFLFWS